MLLLDQSDLPGRQLRLAPPAQPVIRQPNAGQGLRLFDAARRLARCTADDDGFEPALDMRGRGVEVADDFHGER